MTISEDELINMRETKEKISKFIGETTTIKKSHSENVISYLDKFIKFPGSLSVISIFFVSSELVRNPFFGLIGVFLICTSLIIALNILRISLNNDFGIYNLISDMEKPMIDFSRKLTQYSRGDIADEELQNSYKFLQQSYNENSEKSAALDSGTKGQNFIKLNINLSFFTLVAGIILCFISTLNIFC